MSEPLTFHLGTPKSGTTSLQGILARNRRELRGAGYLYPGSNPSHFIEVLGLRDGGFRGHRYEASQGAWERLVAEAGRHGGPVLISHEILGGSTMPAVKRAVASFPGRPLRAIVTCRDLGRQLPAAWQEGVKNGDTEPYAEFLDAALADWKGPGSAKGFWRGQNLVTIARRWGRQIGRESVQFVTVPAPGADPAVLWQRFREAAGLPDIAYGLPEDARNPSLGAVETELLRRVVAALPEDVPWPVYARQVKRRLAQRELVQRRAGGPITVPERYRSRIAEIAAEMLDAVREEGYPVIGSLDELSPAYRPDGVSPDEVSDAALLDRALEVMAPMVLRDRPGKKA
ncbi:hypothetical protein GCM10027062_25610 [Nocardioides hungaricus]